MYDINRNEKYHSFLFGGGSDECKELFGYLFSSCINNKCAFFIGHTFTIPWLMFHHEYRDFEDGFTISTGSFVPLIIGLIVSFIAEKIHVYRNAQKLG